MYLDYLNHIISYYRIGQKNATLPPRLMQPSPANIQKQCLSAFKKSLIKTDLQNLKEFLNTEGDADMILRAIKNIDRDKFKALSNFLTKRSNATNYLNLEILAFLIDFPNRPYKKEDYVGAFDQSAGTIKETIILVDKKMDIYSEENSPVESVDSGIEEQTPKELNEEQVNRSWKGLIISNKKQKFIYGLIAILLPTLVGFYFVIDKDVSSGIFSSGQQKCMIWVGDHYIPSSCEARRGDTVVIAFDAAKIKNFKRINRPDTITLASENKIWYIRRNGVIEYYTTGGRHPVDPKKVLKPLSRYMILKYKNSPQ